MSDRRLLGVYAHPDDEISIAATLLRYRSAGVDTGLVCATRGEAGEIADPALATPENLAEVRDLDPESLGLPDDQISVRVDASPWRETNDRARSMHATQRNSGRFMDEMPEEIRRRRSGQECFQLAASRVGPNVSGENNLFARARPDGAS